ncbi:MAG: AMP-binding protein [Bradymonadaceae bacterium]|nr:AMP-binding protein [Lujinxingiaceae bacterium]
MSTQKNGHDPHQTNGHQANGHANGAAGAAVLARLEPLALAEQASWSVSESLRHRRILITGTTGFLAKVVMSMMLRFHPDIEQIYLVIRGSKRQSAQDRFFDVVAPSGALEPLREIYGDGYLDFLREKITVLGGDVCEPFLGIPEDEARAISSKLDVFIHSAGLTNFNPNLKNALEINTLAMRNIVEFIRLGGCHCSLQHISTTFVAGAAKKPSPEIFPGPKVYPAYDDLKIDYDAEREIADCLALINHTEALSRDQEHHSRFSVEANEKLKKHNLDPNDPVAFDKAYEKIRDNWVARRLSKEGRERAAHWGWPNIYTYTKSLGERVLVAVSDEINLSIVRPAIIESALNFPEPGWNEGINTTAPLCFLVYKGHRFVPTRDGLHLDVIPVDFVAGAMIAITAALIERRQHDVYHLGSSDKNPVTVARLVEMTSLATRKLIDRDVKMPGWKKIVLKSLDGRGVEKATFDRRSAPAFTRALTGLSGLIDRMPTRSMGGVGKALDVVKKNAQAAESMTTAISKIFDLFMPFTHDNKLTFLARNIGELASGLNAAERERYGSPIETLNWRTYWLDVHVPGLARLAYPELEAKFRENNKEVYTYDDLLELFDASAYNFERRVAMQHHHGGITERYTYGELKERADRAALFLQGIGVGTGRPVLLVAENRPQWGMAYFGILKTGGIGVPVDSSSNTAQIVNVAESCRAQAIVVSETVFERLGRELEDTLAAHALPVRVVTFAQLFTLALSAEPAAGNAFAASDDAISTALVAASSAGNPLASLIYTSGTTGNPKGVMLTHKNFTNLLSSLNQTFRISERDGFLSVLPLHHTFEFACGFLMPLSRGSTITYMEEISGDELSSALSSTRVTALIGVPALWQLLYRRIDQKIDDSPAPVRIAFNNMLELNKALRERFGINLGSMLFGAVHQGFGGRIKYLISGGAALPESVLKAFYGMGFDLYEGYGLTEAAPVLTVNSPGKGFFPGSVGKALPGIEIDISQPNAEGVGEVIARGPNVMLGYLGRDEETEKTIKDGWLYTGDLGRVDAKGRLTIVGREKEIIVTSGGKNVYPDELEELYGKCPGVLEFSVVGLPDGQGSERVACLIRPDLDDQSDARQIAEARASIREWIRVEGARVQPHNRLQVLRFWDEEFPRTATRKVKRRDVVAILERLMAAEEQTSLSTDVDDTTWTWLDKALGKLSDFDPARIHNATHVLDDLGFDSLMFVELASILEARGYHVVPERLAQVQTVGELQAILSGKASASTALVLVGERSPSAVDEMAINASFARMTKQALYLGQMRAYGRFFDVEVFGRSNIPHHDPNLIVIANHTSHLDMGLIKFALGDFGTDIRALAAADYFFSNKARKTFFKNFTNLLPVERSGSLERSLGNATEALRGGEMLLMFPEGTRSTDGKIKPFRRGLGYLVDAQVVDILPIYIEGTYRALPKGRKFPSVTSRRLKVYIGKALSAHALRKEAKDMSPTERFEHISKRAQEAVEALRDARGGSNANKVELALEPLFTSLPAKFERNQVNSPVSFYFSLGNYDHHKWTVSVNADKCAIHQGKPNNGQADCVIKTSPEIFRKIVEESYVPSLDEFMNGAIKTNDPDLLLRFQAVFRL